MASVRAQGPASAHSNRWPDHLAVAMSDGLLSGSQHLGLRPSRRRDRSSERRSARVPAPEARAPSSRRNSRPGSFALKTKVISVGGGELVNRSHPWLRPAAIVATMAILVGACGGGTATPAPTTAPATTAASGAPAPSVAAANPCGDAPVTLNVWGGYPEIDAGLQEGRRGVHGASIPTSTSPSSARTCAASSRS